MFDPSTLTFEKVQSHSKGFSLIEYAYTTYWKEYGMWINGLYYRVDKSWGRYLAVNHFAEKVIGYNRNRQYSRPKQIIYATRKLAIPARLPLPQLMSRILVHSTGLLPIFKELDLEGERKWYHVHQGVSSIIADNFFRFKLNMNIEKTNSLD